MSTKWALKLSLDHLHRAGNLRAWNTTEGATDGTMLWLRGDGLDEARQRLLAPIADGPIYRLEDDGRLTPSGNAVPTGRLPDLQWQPLNRLLSPVLPLARMAVVRLPRTALVLERSSNERQAVILVTDWSSFQRWAISAPEIRLQACRFAVEETIRFERDSNLANSVRVVIHGDPLPPLSGERYWLAGCVGVPLGYHWSPAVDISTLETIICGRNADHGNNDKIWIWNRDHNTMNEITVSEMLPVTRSSVRATDVRRTNGVDLRNSSGERGTSVP
jgi:hypothetical protein